MRSAKKSSSTPRRALKDLLVLTEVDYRAWASQKMLDDASGVLKPNFAVMDNAPVTNAFFNGNKGAFVRVDLLRNINASLSKIDKGPMDPFTAASEEEETDEAPSRIFLSCQFVRFTDSYILWCPEEEVRELLARLK